MAITPALVTFRIPTAGKSGDYLIKTSEILTAADPDWTYWLSVNGADILGAGSFGTFTAQALVPPFYDVNVTVDDETNDVTFISFDITDLYNTYSNHFFKAVLIGN